MAHRPHKHHKQSMFKRLKDKSLKVSSFSKSHLLVFIILFGSIGGYAVYRGLAAEATCSSVNQYGVTFSFSSSYACGQYANGDWWVLGPATITAISPAFDGTNNGWEVNPVVSGNHGFDGNCNGNQFSASLVPSLPYVAQAGQSIVKSVDSGVSGRGCLQTAVVLTVVDSAPPGDGAGVFRPPYVGTSKPTILTSELQTNLLPSLAPVANMPSLATIEAEFSRVWLDHKGGQTGRAIHPLDNMEDYGADIATDIHEAALRLMLNDPLSVKMPALIKYVQTGIDQYYMFNIGQTWPDGDGHRPGHRLILAFAATMLNKPEWKAALNSTASLHEDRMVISQTFQGNWLWGNQPNESLYWNTVDTDTGYRARIDPYLYVDGGTAAGNPYLLCCNAQPWKGEILATYIMPSLQAAWNPTEWSQTANLIDRFVAQGTLASPDPCAPRSQGGGPNGSGGCVLDPDLAFYNGPTDFGCKTGLQCGRFPTFAGANIDGGLRYSNFARDMWNAYRNSAPPTTPTVSLSASPTSVTSGSASTLTWSSTNATSCNASGAWSGTKATSGTQSTGSLTTTSTFTLTCTGTGGSASASAAVTVGSAPTAPTLGILDNFNRANQGPPPSSSWSAGMYGSAGGLSVNGNTLTQRAGSGYREGGFWNPASFGPDSEVYATLTGTTPATNTHGWYLFVRAKEIGSSSTLDSYMFMVERSASAPQNWAWQLFQIINGAGSVLGTYDGGPPVIGSQIGLSAKGSQITAWLKTPGGSWQSVISTSDSTLPAAGYIGVELTGGVRTHGFDDFSGGTSLSITQKPGDLNSDGLVNITDLSILLSNYGKPATPSQGDINGDGNCTILDLSILLSKYGT